MRSGDWPAIAVALSLASGCVPGDAPQSPIVNAAAPATEEPARTVQPDPRENTQGVPELSMTMLEHPDPDQRREAVYAIADAEGPDRAAVIGQALTDQDADVREAAVEAMTGIDDGTAADWLSMGLGDPEPQVRRAAVEALGQLGGDTARFLLEQALADADLGVREAAQQMLSEPAFTGESVSPASP